MSKTDRFWPISRIFFHKPLNTPDSLANLIKEITAMSQKMQQLLDLIVNEEMDKANELFHEIVVEKSREIYENLIAEEAEDEEVDEAQKDDEDEEVDESAEDDEELDESSEEDDEEMDENMMGDETTMEIGGDPADDMMADVGDDAAMGGDDMGDMDAPADKGDIQDLEDALAELKREFEALVGGTGGDEEGPEMDAGDDEEGPEMDADDEEDDSDDEETEEMMGLREYRETVKKPGNSEPAGTNTKSVGLQNPKRVDSPANAKNIAQSATGADPKPGVGGLVKKGGDFVKSGTQNVGGQKAKGYSEKVAHGHGADKKGSGESNVNTKDILPK